MKKTSDAVKQSVEAREIRPAWKHTDDDGTVREGSAQWAVIASESGVILAYGEQEQMQARAAKWNQKPAEIPEKLRDKMESAADLKQLLKPGDTVQTILRNCSRSGMSRRISLVIARDGEVRDITWDAARVMEENIKGRAGYVQDAGITVGGCGMDMGFHLVYNLSRTLFPFGFMCAGESCASNDHFNDRNNKRDGKHMHKGDGGYALRHKWL